MTIDLDYIRRTHAINECWRRAEPYLGGGLLGLLVVAAWPWITNFLGACQEALR